MSKKVVLGGTFDHIHIGHEKLLRRALKESEGGKTIIGLVSDEMLEDWKPEVQRPYDERRKALERFLAPYEGWSIVEINDPYEKAVEEDFDSLVVSYETKERGEKVNRMREERGKEPLELIEVKPVLAEDLLPVSSSRIREGEINEMGERSTPVKVHLGSESDVKKEGVSEALEEHFDFELDCRKPKSVKDQPFNREIVEGARKRVEIPEGYDYGIGVESGILEIEGGPFSLEYVVIEDKFGFTSTAHGPGFPIPDAWVGELKEGGTLASRLKIALGERGEEVGAIGLLTQGRVERKDCIKTACFNAMIPRLNAEIYY
ncbi:MAG: pantetheine-phosphate adenylyltransferase [Candidatus Thermoplasmatota archaeon]